MAVRDEDIFEPAMRSIEKLKDAPSAPPTLASYRTRTPTLEELKADLDEVKANLDRLGAQLDARELYLRLLLEMRRTFTRLIVLVVLVNILAHVARYLYGQGP